MQNKFQKARSKVFAKNLVLLFSAIHGSLDYVNTMCWTACVMCCSAYLLYTSHMDFHLYKSIKQNFHSLAVFLLAHGCRI